MVYTIETALEDLRSLKRHHSYNAKFFTYFDLSMALLVGLIIADWAAKSWIGQTINYWLVFISLTVSFGVSALPGGPVHWCLPNRGRKEFHSRMCLECDIHIKSFEEGTGNLENYSRLRWTLV